MNKKEITITAPNGQVIDYNEANGTINFVAEPLDIKGRIKTFDDVLSELQIIPRDFAQQSNHLSKDEVAYRKLKLIIQAFNEGWKPDWSDSNERKYYPWFRMGSPSGGGFSYVGYDYWSTISFVGSRLCFKSSDLAKHAGNLFLDIYKDFLTL